MDLLKKYFFEYTIRIIQRQMNKHEQFGIPTRFL